MGVSNGDEDGGGVDGDGSGGNSPSRQGPEQRLLSPESRLRWWQHCGTFHGRRLNYLGFSLRGHYIGGRAMSVDARGAHTLGPRGQRWARAWLWCGLLGALLRLRFGLRVVLGKIGTLAFVLSNSENISLLISLKHKNSRKKGTGTMASC
jgi:hypothetical protein